MALTLSNTIQIILDGLLFCFVVTALYMLLGLCVSGIFCMWIVHFLPKSWASKALMSFYIVTVVSIKVPFLQELPITGFNHWIILHHNLTGGYRFLITAIKISNFWPISVVSLVKKK